MPRKSLAKHEAESRFRALVGELKLLTMDFPHLREAFDKDDLPVEFILKRGADRAKTKATRALSATRPVKPRATTRTRSRTIAKKP